MSASDQRQKVEWIQGVCVYVSLKDHTIIKGLV